jgi:hypothetical protein
MEAGSSQIPPTLKTDDFTVFGCKSKVVRNPVQRWQFGTGAINAIEFAGDSSNFLATVSQVPHFSSAPFLSPEIY